MCVVCKALYDSPGSTSFSSPLTSVSHLIVLRKTIIIFTGDVQYSACAYVRIMMLIN